MFYYELHEGDEDVFADILLAREEEMAPDLFFETVQAIRRRVQDSFEQDTLIEAIAEELEREHDFVFISDERLTAALNVSVEETENFLADLSADGDDGDEFEDELGEDDLLEEDIEGAAYRTVVAELRAREVESND